MNEEPIKILTPAEIPSPTGNFTAEGTTTNPNYKVVGVVIRRRPGGSGPLQREVFLGRTSKQPSASDTSWRIAFTNIPRGEVLELRVLPVAGDAAPELKKIRAWRNIKLT